MQKIVSPLKAVLESTVKDTTGKIESEMKEVKDKLASLTAVVEKSTGAGQLLETKKNGLLYAFLKLIGLKL